MIIQRLPEYVKEIGIKKGIEHIICYIVPHICWDSKEEILLELIHQFVPLARCFIENREGYSAIVRELIPHYKTFLSDQSIEINKAACDSFY